MNKYIAQLFDDTGVSVEALRESMHEMKEVTVDEISSDEGFVASTGDLFIIDLSDEAAPVTVKSLLDMIPGKIYTLVAYNDASKKLSLSFADALVYPASLTLANGDVLVYRVFTDGVNVFVKQANFA